MATGVTTKHRNIMNQPFYQTLCVSELLKIKVASGCMLGNKTWCKKSLWMLVWQCITWGDKPLGGALWLPFISEALH